MVWAVTMLSFLLESNYPDETLNNFLESCWDISITFKGNMVHIHIKVLERILKIHL